MPAIRREVVLPVQRVRAWELLTDPAELSEWLGSDAERCDEDVEEGERVAFTWDDGHGPSRVEWTLHDAPGGTRVVVVERALAPSPAWGPQLAATWRARLSALARASLACRV
jgi:uncharacterized protein YndB with AHSA1/START domain